MLQVTAYIPCFNNAATVRRAVESVLAQTTAPSETLVIDDGSTDGSVAQLDGLPIRIVRHERNLGRGAARARAMAEARHPLVLCCDATNVLDLDFAANARGWFDDARVAAVFGVYRQSDPRTAAERWRGRHLFKMATPRSVRSDALLATGGAVLRRATVQVAGGFDVALRHSEDVDLGRRLLAGGHLVVSDPRIGFTSIATDTVCKVLERYWRWHAGINEAVSWRGYRKTIAYSLKSMVADDLRAGDWSSAGISVVCPHYQFWKSRLRSRRRAD